jgi:hypothetical protein
MQRVDGEGHLLLLVVPAEHPAQVAAAAAGTADEPESELRFPAGPEGRISGRRKSTPTRQHGVASPYSPPLQPVLTFRILQPLSLPLLRPSLAPPTEESREG